ncbi:MAG TPA: SMP-30/gluconolactonase/LRE family protein [Mycobacteriales bacterium]|nr:SMP-30/gluconolactonase/LRE family protein [Mycobacteriales bacterium]
MAGFPDPRPVSVESAELGEGARWDAATGELLWVDIVAGILRRAVEDGPGLRTVAEVHLAEPLGAVAPVAGGGWLLAAGRGFRHLAPDGGVTTLADTEAAGVRMNDAACDPQGRLWAGTMAEDKAPGGGRLLRCDPDGTVAVVLPAATIPNGLGWSPDGGTLYHADSGPGVVTAYPVDPATGRLGPGRELVRPAGGVPDGLTVDDEGALWVAVNGAGEVHRYSPAGQRLATVRLPAAQVTSVAIGGAGGRRLFVTTAREGSADPEPDAGRVFAVDDVGVGAPPVRAYRGALPRVLSG